MNEDDIRNIIIDCLEKEGFSHTKAKDESEDETTDFFVKGKKLIDVTITDNIDPEILDHIIKGDE